MEYSVSEDNNVVVVKLEGQVLGGPSADKFKADVQSFIEQGKTNMVADLSGVSFMNSSGLGVLIQTLTTLRKEKGDLKLCSAQDRIKSLFKVSKLLSVFDYHDTVEQAVNSY